MNDKYFVTKSKTFAEAILYVTNRKYYKFQNKENITIYSFEKDKEFLEKVNKLNDLRFSSHK